MRRMIAATAAAVLSVGLISATPALADSHGNGKGHGPGGKHAPADADRLTKAVKVNGVLRHLRQFQTIANRHEGNRASGLPGYDASVDYVESVLDKAGYDVTRQTFEFPFFRELSPAELTQLTPEERDLETAVFTYSGSGSVTGPVIPANNNVIPAPPEPGSDAGCAVSDYEPAPEEDAIALVQRGTCDFGLKAANAQEAGYDAVIIFNEGNPERTELAVGTLGEPSDIPVVGLSYDDAVDLVEADDVTATVATETETDLERETQNLLAEWPGTTKNDDEVVVVGAHLDSVTEGPGINDNGSGSAAVLEIAKQYADTKLVRKQQRPVRFAFWGAEELGLIGSQHYVDTLTDEERGDLYANLNFDMLGSPNFVRLVYDGDGSAFGLAGPAGSGEIEDLFLDYFEDQGLETDPTAFDGRSDYGPFIEYGIPAGGLFSGADDVKTEEQAEIYGGTAGEILDPNYHTPEDDITNVNTTVLQQLSDGAAFAVGTMGLSKQGLYGDNARTTARTQLAQQKDYQGDLALR
ncbi:M20/M25/M40 family metallo-hydrolase [Aeromicrobium sp. CTD01-1L150]|uniref:M20/M25/M40 family metallo-hydrolase n=1 Tax=Aeromicrobium sp. CTD01-1L150 TaxID=3341830 RepID=UPI0035C117F6